MASLNEDDMPMLLNIKEIIEDRHWSESKKGKCCIQVILLLWWCNCMLYGLQLGQAGRPKIRLKIYIFGFVSFNCFLLLMIRF